MIRFYELNFMSLPEIRMTERERWMIWDGDGGNLNFELNCTKV